MAISVGDSIPQTDDYHVLILAIVVALHHRYNYNLQLHNLAVGQQSLARRKTALCMKGITQHPKRGYILESGPKISRRKYGWVHTRKKWMLS